MVAKRVSWFQHKSVQMLSSSTASSSFSFVIVVQCVFALDANQELHGAGPWMRVDKTSLGIYRPE